MTAVIILNWNGADDTIACLTSLARADGSFFVVLVDNGSTDDSLSRIECCADELPYQLHILPQTTNLGFARGSNVGIAYAATLHPDDYMLLNNDTEVHPDFLIRLKSFSEQHSEFKVLTPKINYCNPKDVIWNCGGRLFMGFRKYFFANIKDSELPTCADREYIGIGFVTGCALWFLPEVIGKDNKLLTERFFFGEEDFEFSMRMRREGKPIACVMSSLVYHKVGSSGNRMIRSGKVYLHYLNRYIDIRLNFPLLTAVCWRIVNMPLCIRNFRNTGKSWRESVMLWSKVRKEALHKDSVDYQDFVRIVMNEAL